MSMGSEIHEKHSKYLHEVNFFTKHKNKNGPFRAWIEFGLVDLWNIWSQSQYKLFPNVVSDILGTQIPKMIYVYRI